jgi:hypothetical protein
MATTTTGKVELGQRFSVADSTARGQPRPWHIASVLPISLVRVSSFIVLLDGKNTVVTWNSADRLGFVEDGLVAHLPEA